MGVFRTLRCFRRPAERTTAVGSPAHAGWHFLGDAHGRTVARFAGGTRQLELGLSSIPALELVGIMGLSARCAVVQRGRPDDSPDDRQHRDPCSPSGSRRKRGTQNQGLGRSRGGFTSKIHACCVRSLTCVFLITTCIRQMLVFVYRSPRTITLFEPKGGGHDSRCRFSWLRQAAMLLSNVLKFPRFRGHPNICVPGVHHGQKAPTLHA